MWDFFDKLISIALPRVRDFRGVSRNAFDGRGNYTFKEQLIFPKSISIKWRRFAVWTSLLSLLQKRIRKHTHY